MTLIILLLALAVEHFIGVDSELRRFDWFRRYLNWLDNRLSRFGIWNGVGGVLFILAGPLLLLLLVSHLLAELFYPLALLFAFAILLYSLGPVYLFPLLENYIVALEDEDEMAAAEQSRLISGRIGQQNKEEYMLGQVMLQANERFFAVIFWFILLGPFGALLYRLSCQLRDSQHDIHGEFADAAHHLKNILDWPAVRLLVIGNALCGNMVEAIEAWRDTERQSLAVNESVLMATALGAINYEPATETEAVIARSESFTALQSMLHRTLILWFAVLGLMTIAGWLS